MSDMNDGGPAFPRSWSSEPPYHIEDMRHDAYEGMTLRDYFAAKAMQGNLACSEYRPGSVDECAADAYRYADAMLAARANSRQEEGKRNE